jgi:hypothetical protein
MPANYTELTTASLVNPTDTNSRFEQLDAAIENLRDGDLALTAPTISSFANAPHAHTATTGGKLEVTDALKATGIAATQYLKADGANGVAWATDPLGILTTKGDLATRTASAVTRLAVGANGAVLVADSTAGPGLVWRMPYQLNSPVAWQARSASNQTLTASYAKVNFGTEVIDSLGNYDPSTSRFTVTVAGLYLVQARLTTISGSAFERAVIYKNGAASIFNGLDSGAYAG